MIIEIEMTKDTPIYEQLKQKIVEGIATGELKPGEELPSVRQLAADLSVNMHTVAKSYSQLKEEGFLSVHKKKGVVVNIPKMYAASEAYLALLREELKISALMAKCRGVEKDKWLELCEKAYE